MVDNSTAAIVGLIGSLICGTICATITAPKMRNGIGWFFLGMMFGPIAIVLAVIAPPLKPAIPGEAVLDGDVADALTKLSELHDRGALTDAEFEAGKARLLDSGAARAPAGS